MLEALGASEIVSKSGKNEQALRIADNICDTWRLKVGTVADSTCVCLLNHFPEYKFCGFR